MVVALPLELWLLITSTLKPPDLSSLGRSSRQMLQIFRPVLYQNITLKDFHLEDISTLELLARDSVLAGSVVCFDYKCPTGLPAVAAVDVLVGALLNMHALTSLSTDLPFRDEESQQLLVNYFRGRERPLDHLSVHASLFHSEEFGIPKLKSLNWAHWDGQLPIQP
jgi:hypothetical protein